MEFNIAVLHLGGAAQKKLIIPHPTDLPELKHLLIKKIRPETVMKNRTFLDNGAIKIRNSLWIYIQFIFGRTLRYN